MTSAARTYRIGFDVPFEPFGLLENGRPTGMLVELVRHLLERPHVPHEFVTMPLAETERALFSGAVDALAFKGVTNERLSTMVFSDVLIVSGGALFTRQDRASAETLADCNGRRVVTPKKGPLWANIEKSFPALTLIDGDGYEGTFAKLASGEADVAALNLHAGTAIAQRLHPGRFTLPTKPYTELPIAFAIAPSGPVELLRAINTSLAAARADGEHARIHDQWLG
jgi:polar amino acid transport system substrate-binding protein